MEFSFRYGIFYEHFKGMSNFQSQAWFQYNEWVRLNVIYYIHLKINPFIPNATSHPYQLDEYI